MQYFGGKCRIATKISPVINGCIQATGCKQYYEPFCGALWVGRRIDGVDRVFSDANEALITLWRSIQGGWIPPDNLSESEYRILSSKRDPSDPLTAFAGFACSFGGKWFGGYARNNSGVNRAGIGHRSLLAAARVIKPNDVFTTCSYDAIDPRGAVIYCDPPYMGTTGYGAIGKFDTVIFFEWVREVGKSNWVFISEYCAPEWTRLVLDIPHRLSVRSRSGCAPRSEKLFFYGPDFCEMGV